MRTSPYLADYQCGAIALGSDRSRRIDLGTGRMWAVRASGPRLRDWGRRTLGFVVSIKREPILPLSVLGQYLAKVFYHWQTGGFDSRSLVQRS